MTIREYATSRGISYEAAAKQVRKYKNKELKKHISYTGNTMILDDYTIDFLDGHRQPKNIIMEAPDIETAQELRHLRAEIERLNRELAASQEKIIAIQESYTESLKAQALVIEDKTRQQEQLEQARQELTKFKPIIFGLYRRT